MSLIGRSAEYVQGYEDATDRAAPIIEARERDMYEAMRERNEARQQLRGAVKDRDVLLNALAVAAAALEEAGFKASAQSARTTVLNHAGGQ